MHLSSEEALDIIEGRASEDQVRFWRNHVQGCSSCDKQLSDWAKMSSLLKRENLESAPEPSIRIANAIYQAPEIEERSGIRQVIASLVFDSLSEPAMAGARGAAAPHQFLLSAMDFDIHVRVWDAGRERRMTGQILSRDKQMTFQGAQLHLLHQGKRFGSTEADTFGEFEFVEVPTGPLYLQIDLPRLTITGALNLS
jgi:hypothetical protein